MLIHPTAIIHETSQLGKGTAVGAYAVIGADVVLGAECRVDHHACLEGPMIAGAENHFFPNCAVGFVTQDLKYKGEPTHLKIGDHNVFREFCTIHRATAIGDVTVIGDHNLFLAYTHVAHNCDVGNHTIFSNNATLAGHVTVEDYAIISGFGAVHQYCRIGAHSIIGGCSKIVQDVPPFLIADGNPATLRGVNLEGLRRRGFTEEQSQKLRKAYRQLADRRLNLSQALEKINTEGITSDEITQMIAFIHSSKRGIVRREPLATAE